MKRILTFLIASALVFSLAACAGETIETPPMETTSVAQTREQPAEVPTEPPAEQLTATPEPLSEYVQYFSSDAPAVIFEVLYSTLPDMDMLLKVFYGNLYYAFPETEGHLMSRNALGVLGGISCMEPFFIGFEYVSYINVGDAETGMLARSQEASSYDISMKAPPRLIDLSSDLVGDILELEYEDEIPADSDGNTAGITQKWAEGSPASYSSSWIYLDNGYVEDGAMRLTFDYPDQNEAFNTLVSDSFSRLTVPIPVLLDAYEFTYGVYFSPILSADETDALVGSVGQTWWDVIQKDAQMLKTQMDADDSMETVKTGADYSEYYMALDDEYFDGLSISIALCNGDIEKSGALYCIEYTIYYGSNS